MTSSKTRASQIRDVRELAARRFGDARADELTKNLLAFSILVGDWNARSNLVSSQDAERLLSRHIPESIEIAAVVHALSPGSILDLGSGAGFPGVPIALTAPDSLVVLLESRRMKSLFLLRAIQELGLMNCFAWCARAETIGSSVRRVRSDRGGKNDPGGERDGPGGESAHGAPGETPIAWSRLSIEPPRMIPPFDVVTARAVAPLVTLARLAEPIVGPGGLLIAPKGSRLEEEMQEWKRSPGPWGLDSVVAVEPGRAQLVVLRRT